MRVATSVLRDVGLLLLVVLTVAAAAYVLLRDPGEGGGTDVAAPVPTAQPTATPDVPDVVDALFLGSDDLIGTGDLATRTGQELGWDVVVDAVPGTGYVIGPPGQRFVDRLPAALRNADVDVVVVVASASPAEEADGRRYGGNVQFVVAAVRRALPEAEVVLVGPLETGADAAPLQRQVLVQVAARFGAVFVDPSGRGYLADLPEFRGPDGSLTPGAAEQVAQRLAADLRAVLRPTFLPSASPTP